MAWLCDALGVSRSGFHAWLNRSPSARSRSDEVLGQQVKASFLASDRTNGARRVWRDLLADGVDRGLHRIERLIRLQALRARPRRRRLPKDEGDRQIANLPLNLLDRQFAAEQPNHKWIADFTISGRLGLALRVGGHRSVLAPGGGLVDERQHDSAIGRGRPAEDRAHRAQNLSRTRNEAKADVFDCVIRRSARPNAGFRAAPIGQCLGSLGTIFSRLVHDLRACLRIAVERRAWMSQARPISRVGNGRARVGHRCDRQKGKDCQKADVEHN